MREIFVAAALLLVIAIAVLMESVGLSPALGSFLAGVVLADSEYRHELEADIEPFKGLLLGLFFMTVGMIDEDTPGDAQLTHFTTKAFPLQGDPTVEISVTDKNYMKAYFHYEINKDVYTYLRFVTTKSEIDEYIAHFGEEDLREFVRFSDPMWAGARLVRASATAIRADAA